MKKLIIKGGNKLQGSVRISGAKNAALPLMVSSILTDETLTLENIPHVADIATMANLLSNLGVLIGMEGLKPYNGFSGKIMSFKASNIINYTADYDLVRKMRASILILGPLLARFGKARVSLPGGCAIGTRPIDLHLKALKEFGADISVNAGYVEAKIDGRLKAAKIDFEKVSVGATESIMMAATLAEGCTIINNAACEPEIKDLADCLIAMGAKINGAGTSQIKIEGVESLHKATHRIIPDRIEAGTYAIAALISDGSIILQDFNISFFNGFKDKLEEVGGEIIQISENEVQVKRKLKSLKPIDISTKPYPGFPTDMQAQFMALMTISNPIMGKSIIEENIFENRFMHILELVRMGANIESKGNKAVVTGVKELTGAEVMATDLRASVCLVLAALVAKGETSINRLYHLERGYERLAEKLINCGANIKILL